MDATAWDDRYRDQPLVWSAGPNQFVAERAATLPAGRALDVACGEGRNALWLAERGWDVVGTDFSPVAIGKARQIAAERGVTVDFRVADVADLGSTDGPFDLVVLAYLHLPEASMALVLADCAALVAPGGTLLVVGHHVDNPTKGVGGPPDASILHDPQVIADHVRELDVTDADTVTRTVSTDDGDRTAYDSLVVARRRA